MFNVRNGLFETNSSSSHCFILPPSKGQKIPSEIKLSKLMSTDYISERHPSIETRMAFMYSLAEENGYASAYLQYLASKGVNVINDTGTDLEFEDYMFGFNMSESELSQFLFNPDADYINTPAYDEYQSIPKDYTLIHKSY